MIDDVRTPAALLRVAGLAIAAKSITAFGSELDGIIWQAAKDAEAAGVTDPFGVSAAIRKAVANAATSRSNAITVQAHSMYKDLAGSDVPAGDVSFSDAHTSSQPDQ